MSTGRSSLAYVEAGIGKPVILIPGLAGLASFWEPAASELSRQFRTIAVNHPGFGGSPNAEVSISAIAQEVVRLMDVLGIESCAVVGHSTGGLVAQAMALDQPARVSGLILSNTWAEPDRRFRDLFQLRKHVLRTGGPEAYAALGQLLAFPASWYEERIAKESLREFQATPSRTDDLALLRIDMLLGYSRRSELAEISVPTFCIGASDDQIVPFHHMEMLAREIRGSTLASVVGGHFTPLTATTDYVQSVSRFLRSIHE